MTDCADDEQPKSLEQLDGRIVTAEELKDAPEWMTIDQFVNLLKSKKIKDINERFGWMKTTLLQHFVMEEWENRWPIALIEHGALMDLDALRVACLRKNLVLVRYMVRVAKYEINTFKGKDLPPLHAAVDRNALSVVEYLLENGANPNLVDFAGRTPLHLYLGVSFSMAHRYPVEQRVMVEMLLENGALVTQEILDEARENYEYKNISRYILDLIQRQWEKQNTHTPSEHH